MIEQSMMRLRSLTFLRKKRKKKNSLRVSKAGSFRPPHQNSGWIGRWPSGSDSGRFPRPCGTRLV
jgi:hypothetical protein